MNLNFNNGWSSIWLMETWVVFVLVASLHMINGREVTPEEFAIYRQTGQLQLRRSEPVQHQQGKAWNKMGSLAKLGRNLTEEAREGS